MSMKQVVTQLINKQNPAVELNTDEDFQSNFSELGLDSIDVMTIILMIKKELGIDISDDELAQLQTIEELIQYLEK